MAQWKQFSPCHESKQWCGLCKVAKISAGCICQTAACWPKTVCGRDRVHYKSAPQSLNISTWKQQMCNKSMWHRLTIQLTPFSFIKRDAITQKSDEAQLLPPDPCWPKKSCLVNFGLATFSLSVMCKLSLLLCGHQGNEWKQDSMATHQHCLILLSVTSP